MLCVDQVYWGETVGLVELNDVSKVMIKAAKDVRAAKFMHERHPMLGVMGGWGDGSLDTKKTLPKTKGMCICIHTCIYIIVWENMQA